MRFFKIKNRLIHEVLECLLRYNATSMAIFSPYIQGSVVIQVVLFSRLYDMYEINKSDKGIFTIYIDQILPIFILTPFCWHFVDIGKLSNYFKVFYCFLYLFNLLKKSIFFKLWTFHAWKLVRCQILIQLNCHKGNIRTFAWS